MSRFPVSSLVVTACRAASTSSGIRVEVGLLPAKIPGVSFMADAVVLEGIELPSVEAKDLQDKTFRFPVNPEPGYIDGSLYIEHAHHPVDVSSIQFGRIVDGKLPVTFKARLALSYEGLQDDSGVDYEDCDIQLTGMLPSGCIVEVGG